MLMPAGMAIATRAAGPQRIGRVMAALGVPALLGPIVGPVLGGWLIDSVSWRWIFFINVPIGVVAILLAWRQLASDEPRPAERFDFLGMLMLSPGLAALIYGVSTISHHDGILATSVWLPGTVGVVLLVGFVVRALKTANPLIDLALFRNRTVTVSMLTLILYMIAFLGTMTVVPTYFMLVRGESALWAGLLVVPQGIGALLSMPIAGRLVDRVGAGRVVLPGLVLIGASFAVLTHIAAHTPYWLLTLTPFVTGLGMGMTMMPLTSAALQTLTRGAVARASAAVNIVQLAGSSIGSAVVSIILANQLAGRFGVSTSQGQFVATAAMADPATHGAAVVAGGDAFAATFAWTMVIIILSLVPAAFLPRRPAHSPVAAAGEEALPTAVTY